MHFLKTRYELYHSWCVFFVLSYRLIEQRPENFYNFYKICDFGISLKIVDGSFLREIRIMHAN